MENAKKIIAAVLKVDPSEITENTVMDSSVIQGSILMHRMYSTLSAEGYSIDSPESIRTFGDFLRALHLGEEMGKTPTQTRGEALKKKETTHQSDAGIKIGVDIEEYGNFPPAMDYREDRFYADNFSAREISYCILQADPVASFAGKFAAKEAVIKADNSYKSVAFSEIEILNDNSGQPVFEGFALSISHAGSYAVSVAVIDKETTTLSVSVSEQITAGQIKDIIDSAPVSLKVARIKKRVDILFGVTATVFLGFVFSLIWLM
jgi:phosphopantetheine--protein transferase-like protein